MTAPRQVLPGTVYLVTRRCSERRLFLRPSRFTDATFLYVLAVATQRYRVLVHAFCVMSNHYHLIVTDVGAQLPAFMQYVDSLVARATNVSLGRWEGFWSSDGSYSAVSHGATEDIVRKTAYVLANPVAAGLVRTGREWPGLWTAPEQLGTATFTSRRPENFFRSDGTMPESAGLALAVPSGFASAEQYQSAVAAALHDLEAEAQRKIVAARGGFLGRAAVLAQNPFGRPASRERRRQLRPRVAAADPSILAEALSRLVAFLDAYRLAWTARRCGARDVVFPAGTYLLRVVHSVPCAAPS
ncbi:MAG TPA: hypothetical protein VFK90_01880 [Anaeromyxobacter sp.]|nr:hypothetical protein [Anaeromyxobacter sp.]